MQARDVAETGARAALEALAVAEAQPYEHMDGAQRALRLRLRAHARQLGDRLGAGPGAQSIDHVVYECAFEHWHGMLFARFLAENRLLIEPELGVEVTLAARNWRRRSRTPTSGRWPRASPSACCRRCSGRTPGLRGPPRPRTPAGVGAAGREPAGRGVRGRRLARLGLSVLAVRPQGRREPLRGQDRRGRAGRSDATVHRALHGELPAGQLPGGVVGGAPPARGRAEAPAPARKRNCAERRRCPACRSTICASCAATKEKEQGLRGGARQPARSTAGPSSSATSRYWTPAAVRVTSWSPPWRCWCRCA